MTNKDLKAYRAAIVQARAMADERQESAYVVGYGPGKYVVKAESELPAYEADLIVAGSNP